MEVESTLRPQAPGARKYAERFANRLVCVRHRRDDLRARGITTVELVLDGALSPRSRCTGLPGRLRSSWCASGMANPHFAVPSRNRGPSGCRS